MSAQSVETGRCEWPAQFVGRVQRYTWQQQVASAALPGLPTARSKRRICSVAAKSPCCETAILPAAPITSMALPSSPSSPPSPSVPSSSSPESSSTPAASWLGPAGAPEVLVPASRPWMLLRLVRQVTGYRRIPNSTSRAHDHECRRVLGVQGAEFGLRACP